MSDTFVIGFHCHKMSSADNRFLNFIHLIENLLDEQLTYELDYKPKPIRDWPNILARCLDASWDTLTPSITNGIEGRLISVSIGLFPPLLSPGKAPFHSISITLPSCYQNCLEELMVKGGDVLDAVVADWSPSDANEKLRVLVFDNLKTPWTDDIKSRFVEMGLPRFKLGNRIRDCLERPEWIGWLNYWSPETCQLVGFPDPSKDSELLKLSYQTPRGAWLVKLTEEPLDFEREDHRAVIKWAYDRFDQVGARI